MSAAGLAPAVRATSCPSTNTAIVGIERIWKRSPSSGTASVLTLTINQRPAFDCATFTSSGATIRQGPHHGAQKSTTIGSWNDLIIASNASAEGTSKGSAGLLSAVPHFPHFA